MVLSQPIGVGWCGMTEQEKVRRLAIEIAGEPLASFHSGWTPYHTIDDAWVLVKRLRERGWQFTLFDWGIPNAAGLIWTASFAKLREDNRPGYDGGGTTEMEAICEAALAVLDAGA